MSAIVRHSAQPSNKLHSVCPNHLVRPKSDTSQTYLYCPLVVLVHHVLKKDLVKLQIQLKLGQSCQTEISFSEKRFPTWETFLKWETLGDIHLISDDGENGIRPFPILSGQATQRSSPSATSFNN